MLLVPAAGALAACPGEDDPPDSASVAGYARSVVCLINQQRAQAGLALVSADRRLTRAARRFSAAMVRRQFFAHVSPEGTTAGQRARRAGFSRGEVAETIGWGAGALATAAAIVSGWMDSPPHRAIILDGRFRQLGLGVALGSPAGMAAAATVTADFAT